jgi:hypothetical protein
MIKYLSSLLIVLACTYTTYGQLKDVSLSGMIGGLQNEKIALIKDTGESRELLDSIQLKNGEFKWEGKIEQAYVVNLVFPKRRAAQFFLSPGKNDLFVHIKDCKYGFLIGKVNGSPTQDRYEDYHKKWLANKEQKVKVANSLEIPEVNSNPEQKKKLIAEYKKLSQFNANYFKQYASSPVVPYLLFKEYFKKQCSIEFVKEHLAILKQAIPNDIYVRNLDKRIRMKETLKGYGDFPDFKATDLNGKQFKLADTKGKPVLLYIWRAWRPEHNKKHYELLKEIRKSYPDLQIINLIRNSSYNTIIVDGKMKWKKWNPEPNKELNCIELESIDREIDFVGYLERMTVAYLLDQNGKIVVNQSKPELEQLKQELAKHLQ